MFAKMGRSLRSSSSSTAINQNAGAPEELEAKALEDFRDKARELCESSPGFRAQTDSDLQRFLRARGYRVADALELLRASEAWRLENLPVDPAGIQAEINSGLAWICGSDKRNRAAIYIDVTHLDKNTRDLDRTTKFAVWIISSAITKSQSQGAEQVAFIFDLKGFGIVTMDYALVKNLLYLLSNAFPERTALMLMAHSPVVFKSFWAAIRPWIDEGTASKIRFLSNDGLSEFFDSSSLPKQLGGPLGAPLNAGVPLA